MLSATHRERWIAARTMRRAAIFSCALHMTVVGGLSITAGLKGQSGRITDISAETTLQFSFSEEPPEFEPAPDTQPVEPVPESKVSETKPVEASTEQARDDVFGKQVTNLPTPTTPTEAVSPSEPTTVQASKWVEAPPPPPPEDVPIASFAGVEARPARRVVYLIDGSGPMAASLNFIKSELSSSIARLNPDQSFQVIVYRQPSGGQGEPISYYFRGGNGQPDLTPAELAAKSGLRAWLENVYPAGRSEPLLGLEAALRLQPDLIFVLTRSIARSGGVDIEARNQQILAMLEQINPRQPLGGRLARIKTIQFLDDDPTGLMQAIAAAHGDGEGSYRLISRNEVVTREK